MSFLIQRSDGHYYLGTMDGQAVFGHGESAAEFVTEDQADFRISGLSLDDQDRTFEVINDGEASYSLKRFFNGAELMTLRFQDHKTTTGIVQMVFGDIPSTLEAGGDLDEEWNLSLGAGNWLIVKRVL